MNSRIKRTVEVSVASSLQNLVGGASTVRAQGETVEQLLENLDSRFPGFKGRTINKWGKLNSSVLILLNDEDIRSLKGLETPLKDSDAISIMVVLSGG